MIYDVVTFDVVGPTILQVHDAVGISDIVGPDLRCRMLSSYVMLSGLTYEVVGDLHHVAYDVVGFLDHVAYDIPCDDSFEGSESPAL